MISIECYKGLPIEFESFLIEKYDSYFTTCRYIEIYYPDYEVSYMNFYENGTLTELIIYGNKGDTTKCFNSLVVINQKYILEFINKIFEKYPSTHKIIIDASFNEYKFKKAVLYSKSNDHIIDLPSTMDDYYKELGYHTRKNSKNRKVRLTRDYPGVNFITKYGDEIEEGVIDKIIQLNIDRMKHKGIIPGRNNSEKKNIYKYSQHYGCVTYIEIEGLIVAGFISTILNKKVFGHVIAHDNKYSTYNVGEVCMFYLIQTSIEKGMATFHFSWGENEYKKRILANPHLLFSYYIYRTYSIDYIINKIRTIFSSMLINLRLSKFSKPLRDVIKSLRKKVQKSSLKAYKIGF